MIEIQSRYIIKSYNPATNSNYQIMQKIYLLCKIHLEQTNYDIGSKNETQIL